MLGSKLAVAVQEAVALTSSFCCRVQAPLFPRHLIGWKEGRMELTEIIKVRAW